MKQPFGLLARCMDQGGPIMRTLILTTTLLTLGACTTPYGPRHESDYDRLARECAARGGILAPIGGPTHGNPVADNTCEIHGSPPPAH